MARNEEKAQSMLYRFREHELVEAGLLRPRNEARPTSIMSVTSVKDAEHWRSVVFKEISKKVSRIQNPGLNEYEIRETNDEINRLLKEKSRWEFRIKDLGGKNYMRASRMLDNLGRDISGIRGYKYFGQARSLPGVKELLEAKDEKEEHEPAKVEKRALDEDYYGHAEEVPNGDVDLLAREAEHEAYDVAVALNAWRTNMQASRTDQTSNVSAPSAHQLAAARLSTPDYIPSQKEVVDYLKDRFNVTIMDTNILE